MKLYVADRPDFQITPHAHPAINDLCLLSQSQRPNFQQIRARKKLNSVITAVFRRNMCSPIV